MIGLIIYWLCYILGTLFGTSWTNYRSVTDSCTVIKHSANRREKNSLICAIKEMQMTISVFQEKHR